jgi:hypothetical protein
VKGPPITKRAAVPKTPATGKSPAAAKGPATGKKNPAAAKNPPKGNATTKSLKGGKAPPAHPARTRKVSPGGSLIVANGSEHPASADPKLATLGSDPPANGPAVKPEQPAGNVPASAQCTAAQPKAPDAPAVQPVDFAARAYGALYVPAPWLPCPPVPGGFLVQPAPGLSLPYLPIPGAHGPAEGLVGLPLVAPGGPLAAAAPQLGALWPVCQPKVAPQAGAECVGPSILELAPSMATAVGGQSCVADALFGMGTAGANSEGSARSSCNPPVPANLNGDGEAQSGGSPRNPMDHPDKVGPPPT